MEGGGGEESVGGIEVLVEESEGVAVTCSTTHHNCRHKCSTVGGRQEPQTGKN